MQVIKLEVTLGMANKFGSATKEDLETFKHNWFAFLVEHGYTTNTVKIGLVKDA